jgi:hypothetical protein
MIPRRLARYSRQAKRFELLADILRPVFFGKGRRGNLLQGSRLLDCKMGHLWQPAPVGVLPDIPDSLR